MSRRVWKQERAVNLGARVREWRHKAGITQVRAAEEVGVTHQQLQKYEKGVNRLPAEHVTVLARLCQVTPSELGQAMFDSADGSSTSVSDQASHVARMVHFVPEHLLPAVAQVVKKLAETQP